MRGQRIGGVWNAAAFVTLLAIAVLASAAPAGAARHRAEVPLGFSVKASNGYTLEVYGFDESDDEEGPSGAPGEVYIFVRKPGAAVLYLPDQRRVSNHSIEASIDGIAKIDVHYVASTAVKRRKRACSDERIRYEAGRYEGTIEFQGEQGFTDVVAPGGAGTMNFLLEIGCTDGYSENFGRKAKGARLGLGTSGEADLEGAEDDPVSRMAPTVGFEVIENRGAKRARLSASVAEDLGSVIVLRGIERKVPASWFSYRPTLATARFDPNAPGPFSGSASFRRAAGPTKNWTGDLSVDLPGRSDVPLVGPGIHAAVSRASYHPEKPYPYD